MKEMICCPFKYIKSVYSTLNQNVVIYGYGQKIKERRKLFNIIPYWKTINVQYF